VSKPVKIHAYTCAHYTLDIKLKVQISSPAFQAANISACLNDFWCFMGIGPGTGTCTHMTVQHHEQKSKKVATNNKPKNYVPFHPRRLFLEIQGHISAPEHLDPAFPLPTI